MRTRLIWGVVLVLIALAAALVVLPARWLLAVVPEQSPVAIVDAHGTLWQGSATLAVGAPGHRRALPDPITWSFQWKSGPRLVARHAWMRNELMLSPSWRGVRLSGQTLQLPAQALVSLHAMFNTLDPGGELLISWPERVFGLGGPERGERLLDVQWRHAAAGLSRVRPLGAYQLTATQGEGGQVDLKLETREGPLLMRGQGKASAKGMQLDGVAEVDSAASGDTRAGLQNLLNALGTRQGEQAILRLR
ncbi:type II secretion system protein N [Pusillimonas sp. CC-YST705]|uniref:Type II secretion system protein N n=1 Tax=Mesopusillimonas faecipullorum TaxID=2755040 RepID=A0ABS8CEX2_9BURK|nr:type II secretion system protein N [Mesopusillimonas faecipullorum]MCB5364382.1 type II secretion system protein N [Mesopusillimonas faecipullorum]